VREEDLKETFSRLHARPIPVRRVSASDIILDGDRVLRRRRTVAVVGSGLGVVAVVGVAVLALALKPGGEPVQPAVPTVSSAVPTPGQPTTPPPSFPAEPPAATSVEPVEPPTASTQPIHPPTSAPQTTPSSSVRTAVPTQTSSTVTPQATG
jgi:hypothetical protein